MNTTLIIMAAGIGSRFGEGIKQLAQMGPNGEIIMDYSIHDAKEAGFNKVVFIIRKDISRSLRRSLETGSKNISMLNMYFRSLMICQKVLRYQKEEQNHGEQDRLFYAVKIS